MQRKVPCLFVTEVKDEPSAKRERQVAAAAPGREDGGRQVGLGPCPSPGGVAGPRFAAARTVPKSPATAECRPAVDVREPRGRGLQRVLPLKCGEEGPSECRVSSSLRFSWHAHTGVHPDAVFAFLSEGRFSMTAWGACKKPSCHCRL